jgi:hypothetical protein
MKNTITYSINWMGVANMQWYRDRGLIEKVTQVLEKDSVFSDKKAGDIVEYEKITETYSCGRIDVRGTDDPYGDEIGVPPMHAEDWHTFGEWLDTMKTDRVWSRSELVAEYEKTNPAIRWRQDI